MKVQAHVFTGREISLLQKAVYSYLQLCENEDGEFRADLPAYYKKEYEDMKALYLSL